MTLGSFIRLSASDIASQFYYTAYSFIVLRTVFGANKIPLKPQGFNKTFGLPKIKLCTQYRIKPEKLQNIAFYRQNADFLFEDN
ncbi:MAG: hypothetical protein ACI4VI_03185 [Acutalibacteraceae bacterium]